MSFIPKTNSNKQYSIALKTANGNVAGYINLSSQLVTAMGKQPESITIADILSLNNGDFQGFINSLTVEVTESSASKAVPLDQF